MDIRIGKLSVVALACNLSMQEAEAGGSPQLRDQPRLQSEVRTSLNCLARPCLKKKLKPLEKGKYIYFHEYLSIEISKKNIL